MQTPFIIEGESRVVTTSIGAAIATGHNETPDSLLKKADGLLYLAKRLGKNQFQILDAAADADAPRLPCANRTPPITTSE